MKRAYEWCKRLVRLSVLFPQKLLYTTMQFVDGFIVAAVHASETAFSSAQEDRGDQCIGREQRNGKDQDNHESRDRVHDRLPFSKAGSSRQSLKIASESRPLAFGYDVEEFSAKLGAGAP